MTRAEEMAAARAQLETSTLEILELVQRSESLGAPLTPIEEKIFQQRNRCVRASAKNARDALNKFIELAVHAVVRNA